MSGRRVPRDPDPSTPTVPVVRPRRKSRGPRVRLTHLEVRRGDALRLRIAVADDALAEVGDELGALLKKIAPGTRTEVVARTVVAESDDLVIERQHAGDDVAYHEKLRENLTALFESLCDAALEDALRIAREERARRAEGGN